MTETEKQTIGAGEIGEMPAEVLSGEGTPPADDDQVAAVEYTEEELDRLFPVMAVCKNEISMGNPAGGEVEFRPRGQYPGTLGRFEWQNGVVHAELGPNGVTVEAVLAAVKQRLEFYQHASDGKFSCVENDYAIAGVLAAQSALEARRMERLERGVLNKHEK